MYDRGAWFLKVIMSSSRALCCLVLAKKQKKNNFNFWRLRWKKGARIFTQNWTLSKTLQISHAVLFRCVKQCSVCFFAEVFFVYEILRMQKSLYLWSHQHVTGKTVISLKIQQNIDLLQRVTLKSVDFRVKPLQFWFHVNVRPQRR